uniref:Shugoshin 2 n=1 Tax=Ursus americanus TaxID=9643 RepID=A0A452RGL6_URSAM
MEHTVMDTGSLFTSGIKRHVKDKRISRTGKLNVSLASKIKTKILNNSSIFKISLKHNNRALAQALSREKENSRRIATDKTLLQKEVEKLNFENTFLRLKLNNLVWKLYYKEKMQYDDNVISKISPDSPSSVSTRQPLSSQYNLELLFLKENNHDMCGLHDSDIFFLLLICHLYSDQNSMSSPMSEMKNAQSISHRKEKPSLSNVTERKKHVSSQESNNPSVDSSHGTDLDQQHILSPELNWNNEINDHTNEKNIKMQGNIQCLPDSSESTSEPTAEYVNPIQGSDDFQLQKTVYDADMDLTASEVSKIVTVSTGTKNKRDKKSNDCGIKTFRKVKDSSSEKKRERSKRQFKNSSDINIEEKIENGPEKRSVVLNSKGDSEDPNFIFNTEQLTQLNILKKETLHNGFDEEDGQNTQCNKRKKRIHVTNEQEEAYSFSQSSDKFDIGQSSLAYHKSKASRQTFVIPKLEKGNLFSNQKNKETTSENLEVTSAFQTADLSAKDNESLCEYEPQNMLDLRKHVTDMQPAQQNESKINEKLRQKVNRKTEIISETNKVYGDTAKDVHGPGKGYFSFQAQEDKETISGNLTVSDEFQKPALSTIDNGNPCDCEIQNVLDLQKQITDVYPVQQNESKVPKTFRQKVNRKTEIISEVNHLDKNVYFPEKGSSFFLTQKDKEIIPENIKGPSEFQTPSLSTKDSGSLYDYETQNVLGVEKHVHDMQPACQNESKIDKKLRQKICRKTEIISKINQVDEKDDKGIHDPEKDNLLSLTQKEKEIIPENLEDSNEFQIADPSTRDLISGYSMEINSNEKENCDQISNPYKLVKKHGKESSGKAKIFAKGKNKSISQLPDSLQTSVFLESDLKYITNEADSDPGKHMDLQENLKESSTTLNEKRDIPLVEVVKEGECQGRKVNKTASKSKKRKTIYPSESQKVMQVVSDTDQGISVKSGQTDEEKNSANERAVKMKADFYKEAFKSLSQVYSPNIQDSSFKSMHEDLVPLSISPSKNLVIKENFALESSPVFQVSDDDHEKMKGRNFNQRTQKSGIGGRTLQDLTNTSFVSNNAAKAENKSENPSLELSSRRRRCTPLYLKEPNLKR